MTFYVYGLDPAEHWDYFGIVVHKMEDGKPKLQTLRKLRNITYPEVQHLLKQELFANYPPKHIIIDYSNEKTFSEMLIRKYGNHRVEAINFTQQNKLTLKQAGFKILQLGYEWPKSSNQQVQGWIDELRDQLRHEQMLQLSSGKFTFDHPVGEHNDLAIAWELSIHGCLKLMLKPKSHLAVGKMGSMAGGYYKGIRMENMKIKLAQKMSKNPAEITEKEILEAIDEYVM